MGIETAKAEEKRNRTVLPTHRCGQCEGRTEPAANPRLRCQALKIEQERDEEIRKTLKRQRLWRGEGAMRALLDDYYRIMAAVDAAGGEVDPNWPARLGRAAAVVLSARSLGRAEADIERGRTHSQG